LLEGLPTVLIEAMFCGNVLISYDCPTGPSEIINEKNGFLIKMHDLETFTKKLNQLVNDAVALENLMISSVKESENWRKEKILEL
jgi:glycosyltransferase involved in cell wall biosynthesis